MVGKNETYDGNREFADGHPNFRALRGRSAEFLVIKRRAAVLAAVQRGESRLPL
jgi:hypothetical protein